MGAGHSDADFDAELGTQETGGTLVGHEAGNRSREPSPMKGMIYEVAVQQPVSPRRWAFTPQPSKEESCTQERHNGPKEAREATETDTRRVMRRGKNRRWTGGCKGWSRSRERRFVLTVAETKKPFPENDKWILSQEHDSTFKLLWR